MHYNPQRGIFILSRYDDVRAAARADHALSSADGVTYGRMQLPVLLTTDAPAHTRMRKQALHAPLRSSKRRGAQDDDRFRCGRPRRAAAR